MANNIAGDKDVLTKPGLQLTVADWAEVKKEASPISKRNKQKDIIRAKVRSLAFADKKPVRVEEWTQTTQQGRKWRKRTATFAKRVDTKETGMTKSLKRKAEEAEHSDEHSINQQTAIAREAARRSMSSNSGVPREGPKIRTIDPSAHETGDVDLVAVADTKQKNVKKANYDEIDSTLAADKQPKKKRNSRKRRFYA